MSRRPRYILEGGAMVEVTCRTIHSRFLLRPAPSTNEPRLDGRHAGGRRHPSLTITAMAEHAMSHVTPKDSQGLRYLPPQARAFPPYPLICRDAAGLVAMAAHLSRSRLVG